MCLIALVFLAAPILVENEHLAICNRFDISGPIYRKDNYLLALSAISIAGAILHINAASQKLPTVIGRCTAGMFLFCVLEINFNKDDFIESAGHDSLLHTITATLLLFATFTIIANTLYLSHQRAQMFFYVVLINCLVITYFKGWSAVNVCAAVTIGLVSLIQTTSPNAPYRSSAC